jgi:FkbM family methyltransferase
MTPLQRSLMTISCRDSDPIAKVPDAGRTLEVDGERVQVMHNGIRVVHGGYHGDWMAHIIRGLRGHHEPQEEVVFDRLLRYVRDGSLIVELGAFWAYYTQWYLRDVPGSRALCIEPDPHNLSIGRRNSTLNGNAARIRFEQAWIGGEPAAAHSAVGESSPDPLVLPQLDFAGVRALCPQSPIEVLHLDIQGAELGFLRSIPTRSARDALRFVMLSTHHSSISGSTTTHPDCLDALRALGATILVEHDVIESYSGDGLILASLYDEDRALDFPPISRNVAATSLFQTP